MIGIKSGDKYELFDGLKFKTLDEFTGKGENGVVYNEDIDFFITPYNLDTNELALFSTEHCNIDCEYCHYKYFKNKFMGDTPLDSSFELDKVDEYIKSTMPEVIEFIGGEHSMVPEKIIAVDAICKKYGAPDNLIIELDTNGTLYENLYDIAINTKHVHFIFSYESSDTDTNKRGLDPKVLMDFILKFNKDFPGRTEVRFLFFHGASAIEEDLKKFSDNNVYVREAYQICDINKKFGEQTSLDVFKLIDGRLKDLYYKAVSSFESELYGYGRSCIDTLVREGWTRKLQGCYILDVINADNSEIIDSGKISPAILERHRKMMYEFALTKKRVALIGGCSCAAENIDKRDSDEFFGNDHVFSYIRAQKLFSIDDKKDFELKKQVISNFYDQIAVEAPISQEPVVLLHFYTGSNVPSNRTVQRYFSMLGHRVGEIKINVSPYCYSQDLDMWKIGNEVAFVDVPQNIQKYSDNDLLVLAVGGHIIQFLLMGTKSDILKEVSSGFNSTSPSIYRSMLTKCLFGK